MLINSTLANLGDNLWLLPLFQCGLATEIALPDHPQSRSVAPIFDGLAKNVIYGNIDGNHVPDSQERTQRAARHLGYFGKNNESCIPKIIFKENELDRAKTILKGIENPIAVNFTTMNAGGDHCSARRIMNSNQIEFVVKTLIEAGFTPVNLGLGHNTASVVGVMNILDLNIRDTAACYAIIGKYIGTESGTSNLMIAAGGRAIIYHPDSDDTLYPAWKCHFTEDLWIHEPCRAKYLNFNLLNNLPNDLDFLTKNLQCFN